MIKITPDIYKIPGEGSVYIYLGNEPFVIDTGRSDERKSIETELKKIIDPKKIKRVLLTHLHYDHTGNVNLFPNAEFFASKQEIEDYKEDPTYFFFGKVPKEIDSVLDRLKPLPKKINSLEVMNVPGHTRGGVAFIDLKRKLLFSGDTVFHRGIGRTDLPNSSPEEMSESVKRILKKIEDKNLELHPGHDY